MERLTKHSEQTSHENGICCTHFYGPECIEVGGNCAMNCKWEEAAWSRLAAYEDTGLEPWKITAMQHTLDEYHKVADPLLRAQADGRLVVLPFTSGRTLLSEENIDSPRLMKDVELAIRYCSSCGIVFYMGYNVFCDLVKHGRITAVSEETEKALGAMKDE